MQIIDVTLDTVQIHSKMCVIPKEGDSDKEEYVDLEWQAEYEDEETETNIIREYIVFDKGTYKLLFEQGGDITNKIMFYRFRKEFLESGNLLIAPPDEQGPILENYYCYAVFNSPMEIDRYTKLGQLFLYPKQ